MSSLETSQVCLLFGHKSPKPRHLSHLKMLSYVSEARILFLVCTHCVTVWSYNSGTVFNLKMCHDSFICTGNCCVLNSDTSLTVRDVIKKCADVFVFTLKSCCGTNKLRGVESKRVVTAMGHRGR